MSKHGGRADIIELFRHRRQSGSGRFLALSTIAREINVSEERTARILTRPSNTGVFRRSTGNRPNVWTLTELDR